MTDKTAAMLAAQSGNLRNLRLLVDAGADLGAQVRYGGTTALTLAVERGHTEVVWYLLEGKKKRAGVNVDAGTPPPIVSAAEIGNVEMAVALIDAGADVDVYDHMGVAAVGHAAQKGYPDVLKVRGESKQINMQGLTLVEKRPGSFFCHITAVVT